VFEVSEDECGFGDVAGLAGAGRGVVEGAPAAGEYGESVFAQATQAAQECVVGAVVHVECLVAGGLLTCPRSRPPS
jgi:hypothetical protein